MTMDGRDVTRMMPRDGERGGHREDLRWEYQTKRDERLYRAGWFVDFRQRWQAALRSERLVFKARLEAL